MYPVVCVYEQTFRKEILVVDGLCSSQEKLGYQPVQLKKKTVHHTLMVALPT